jgi:hypothetical protein
MKDMSYTSPSAPQPTKVTTSVKIDDKAVFLHFAEATDNGDLRIELRSRRASTVIATMIVPKTLRGTIGGKITGSQATPPPPVRTWVKIGEVRQ